MKRRTRCCSAPSIIVFSSFDWHCRTRSDGRRTMETERQHINWRLIHSFTLSFALTSTCKMLIQIISMPLCEIGWLNLRRSLLKQALHSNCLSFYLSVHLTAWVSVFFHNYLLVCLPLHVSLPSFLPIYLRVCLPSSCLCVYLSVCLPVCLYVCLFVCLSVSLYVCLVSLCLSSRHESLPLV